MKVYELISVLSKCPAGAEVSFSMLASVDEIIKADPQEDDGKIYYEITRDINEAEDASTENKKRVFLYA